MGFARWMNATRDGECAECEDTISEGDRIVYADYKAYCKPCGAEVAGDDPADDNNSNPFKIN